jgi:hypothetical protein
MKASRTLACIRTLDFHYSRKATIDRHLYRVLTCIESFDLSSVYNPRTTKICKDGVPD